MKIDNMSAYAAALAAYCDQIRAAGYKVALATLVDLEDQINRNFPPPSFFEAASKWVQRLNEYVDRGG